MTTSSRSHEIEADLRKQAKRHARLTPAEERALLGKRDSAATERLLEHNLDLVVRQAEEHRDRGLGFADLYQEGTVGLVDAIAAYGSGDFRDFASLHIGLQMDSLIDAEEADRRRAGAAVEDSQVLDMAEAEFRQRHRRDAEDGEMAAILGWDLERVRQVSLTLDRAREENDAATITFLDEGGDELGVDFLDDEPEVDPRRRPPGAGPD